MKLFLDVWSEHLPWAHNKHANALAIWASKIDVLDDAMDDRIMKRTLQAPLWVYFLTVW